MFFFAFGELFIGQSCLDDTQGCLGGEVCTMTRQWAELAGKDVQEFADRPASGHVSGKSFISFKTKLLSASGTLVQPCSGLTLIRYLTTFKVVD